MIIRTILAVVHLVIRLVKGDPGRYCLGTLARDGRASEFACHPIVKSALVTQHDGHFIDVLAACGFVNSQSTFDCQFRCCSPHT